MSAASRGLQKLLFQRKCDVVSCTAKILRLQGLPERNKDLKVSSLITLRGRGTNLSHITQKACTWFQLWRIVRFFSKKSGRGYQVKSGEISSHQQTRTVFFQFPSHLPSNTMPWKSIWDIRSEKTEKWLQRRLWNQKLISFHLKIDFNLSFFLFALIRIIFFIY